MERRRRVMATASSSKTYVCSTCGEKATRQGHLCDPVLIEDAALAVCEFCGITATDPRHVCFPKRLELSHSCGNCGRLATTASLLCKPKAIPKPKAKAAAGAKKLKKKAATKAIPPKTAKARK